MELSNKIKKNKKLELFPLGEETAGNERPALRNQRVFLFLFNPKCLLSLSINIVPSSVFAAVVSVANTGLLTTLFWVWSINVYTVF